MTSTTTLAPTGASLSTRRKTGLVIAGLYALSNIPSAFVPAVPEGSGDGPPMAILVVCSVLGAIGVVAAVLAWRGSDVANRVCAGAIVVCTITGLPAFFVDVPMGIKALVGAGVLITVLAVVLMFSGPRRAGRIS